MLSPALVEENSSKLHSATLGERFQELIANQILNIFIVSCMACSSNYERHRNSLAGQAAS